MSRFSQAAFIGSIRLRGRRGGVCDPVRPSLFSPGTSRTRALSLKTGTRPYFLSRQSPHLARRALPAVDATKFDGDVIGEPGSFMMVGTGSPIMVVSGAPLPARFRLHGKKGGLFLILGHVMYCGRSIRSVREVSRRFRSTPAIHKHTPTPEAALRSTTGLMAPRCISASINRR